MPVRLENRARYPKNWPEISASVRDDAGQRCEWCGVENGRMIRRGTRACGQAVWRYADDSAYMDSRCARTGAEVPDSGEDMCDLRDAVRVVLTVAHLDHQPENCARENLRALCQRCHNAYDAPMRLAGIRERWRAVAAAGDLFQNGDPDP